MKVKMYNILFDIVIGTVASERIHQSIRIWYFR